MTPIALSASRTGSTLHETRPGPGRLPKKSISAMKRSSVGRKRPQKNLSILIFSAGSDFEHEKTKRLEFFRKPNFQNSEHRKVRSPTWLEISTRRWSPTSPKTSEIDSQRSKNRFEGFVLEVSGRSGLIFEVKSGIR